MNVPRGTYATPVSDARLDEQDTTTWNTAMEAYAHARGMGLSRLEAFEALRPLLDHPRLATSAQIMLDVAEKA